MAKKWKRLISACLIGILICAYGAVIDYLDKTAEELVQADALMTAQVMD